MPEAEPVAKTYKTSIRANFEKQSLMRTLGAKLALVEPGRVVIELPFRSDLCQQDGYLHAGVLASILDSACGYAAMTLLPPGADVLSVEFKTNFLTTAKGNRFLARGRVVRAGGSLTACAADAFAMGGRTPTLVATMLATMVTRRPPGRGTHLPTPRGMQRLDAVRSAG